VAGSGLRGFGPAAGVLACTSESQSLIKTPMVSPFSPRHGGLAFAAFATALLFCPAALGQEATSPWTFSGDARFRLEFNDNSGQVDRHRQRLRLRLGARYKFNDELTVGGRMTTGNPDDPKSPYQDLGKGFSNLEFTLDRLFMQYQPEWLHGGTLVAGKFANPIYRNPVYGELVWDADVQPEGIALAYDLGDWGPFQSSQVGLAQLALLEQSNAEELWASLLYWNGKILQGDEAALDLSVSYSFYGDMTPDGSGALLGNGNATAGSEFVSDFGILDAILAYSHERFVVSTEFIRNLRADNSVGDTGLAVGGAVKTESGKFYYQYQTIEQDALMALVSQDDFLYTTNYNTHVVGWKKNLMDQLGLHVWLMASELEDAGGGSNDMVYRFRVDLTFKF
jgi:putative porin